MGALEMQGPSSFEPMESVQCQSGWMIMSSSEFLENTWKITIANEVDGQQNLRKRRKHKGGRIWYQGSTMLDGNHSEFDEDMSSFMRDLSSKSNRLETDMDYTYCMADIDTLAEELGIPWEHSMFGSPV